MYIFLWDARRDVAIAEVLDVYFRFVDTVGAIGPPSAAIENVVTSVETQFHHPTQSSPLSCGGRDLSGTTALVGICWPAQGIVMPTLLEITDGSDVVVLEPAYERLRLPRALGGAGDFSWPWPVGRFETTENARSQLERVVASLGASGHLQYDRVYLVENLAAFTWHARVTVADFEMTLSANGGFVLANLDVQSAIAFTAGWPDSIWMATREARRFIVDGLDIFPLPEPHSPREWLETGESRHALQRLDLQPSEQLCVERNHAQLLVRTDESRSPAETLRLLAHLISLLPKEKQSQSRARRRDKARNGREERPVKRQINELSPGDLEQHPLWEFAYDEGAQDEATVSPASNQELAHHGDVTRATFIAADGTQFSGYLTLHPDHHPGRLQPTVITDKGQVNFWLGWQKSEVSEEMIRPLYEILGKSADQLFPISYRLDMPSQGGPLEGTIGGFMWLPELARDEFQETR